MGGAADAPGCVLNIVYRGVENGGYYDELYHLRSPCERICNAPPRSPSLTYIHRRGSKCAYTKPTYDAPPTRDSLPPLSKYLPSYPCVDKYPHRRRPAKAYLFRKWLPPRNATQRTQRGCVSVRRAADSGLAQPSMRTPCHAIHTDSIMENRSTNQPPALKIARTPCSRRRPIQ